MKKKALLLLVPFLGLLAGCTQSVNLQGSEQQLAQRKVTESTKAVVFPDDNPSIPDGKVVWEKMNCAECHGANGQPVADKAQVDLSSETYMYKQKPLDQYVFLTYGKEGVNHTALKDKLSTRELWDLVFYTRSLAITPLKKAEWDQIDPVFGANCAVCHGKKGFGDGPQLAHNMEPQPANFHQFNRFYDRDDATLLDHIANGIVVDGKPTFAGMPNFKDKVDRTKNVKFDEAYMRKLVQYVRLFHSSTEPTTLAQPGSAKK